MGIATFALLEGAGQGPYFMQFGDRHAVIGKVTMSSSYATSGDSILVSAFGMETIDMIMFLDTNAVGNTHADGVALACGGVNTFPVSPSTATLKIQAFWSSTGAVNPEVTNATDLSTYSCPVWVIGT